MEQKQEPKAPCRSIFKNGQSATSTEAYTNAWITLISQAERSKNGCAGEKHDGTPVI